MKRNRQDDNDDENSTCSILEPPAKKNDAHLTFREARRLYRETFNKISGSHFNFVGSSWYVIDFSWWDINFMRQINFAGNNALMVLPPISCSSLVNNIENAFYLKPDLVEGVDYFLMPEDMFTNIVKFCSVEDSQRDIILRKAVSGVCIGRPCVEVYSRQIKVIDLANMESIAPIVKISGNACFQQAQTEFLAALNTKPCSLTRFFVCNKGVFSVANPHTILSAESVYVDLKGEKNSIILNQESQMKINNSKNEIIEALKCSICIDIFKDPKILPCGHSFCYECIEQHRKSNANKSALSIRCPQCRDVSNVPTGGYKTNYTAKDAINGLAECDAIQLNCGDCKKQIDRSGLIQCESCINDKYPQMRVFLCSKCAINHHYGHSLKHCTIIRPEERFKVSQKIGSILDSSIKDLRDKLNYSKNLVCKYFDWLDSTIDQVKMESKKIEKSCLGDEILFESETADVLDLASELAACLNKILDEDLFCKIKYFDHTLQAKFRSSLRNHGKLS